MAEYTRTRVKALSIRGYRSVRKLELADLPPLIVLHGRNGAGKSNILNALRLVLGAAEHAGDLHTFFRSLSTEKKPPLAAA